MLLIMEQSIYSFNLPLITESSDELRETCEGKGEFHAAICPSSLGEDVIECQPTACLHSYNLMSASNRDANYQQCIIGLLDLYKGSCDSYTHPNHPTPSHCADRIN